MCFTVVMGKYIFTVFADYTVLKGFIVYLQQLCCDYIKIIQ